MKNSKASTPRLLLLLLLNFVIVFTVYQVFLTLGGAYGLVITALYIAAAAALGVAYFVINRGFGKPIADPADLPEKWSAKEKTAYIADAARRHQKARLLLLWLIPFVITIMLDMTGLFILDPLLQMLG